MNAQHLIVMVTVAVFAGCGSRAHPAADHERESIRILAPGPLLPLEPGTVWIYEGDSDGLPLVEEIAVLDPVAFGGIDSDRQCLPVVERRYLDGQLVEVSIEWLMHAADGSVWQLGEASLLLDANGDFRPSGDDWRAGEAGAEPVLVLPANPEVGAVIEQRLPHGTETYRIVRDDAVVETPAGTFGDCTEVHEGSGGEDQDIVLYAPGVGVVAAQAANGRKVLVRIRRR